MSLPTTLIFVCNKLLTPKTVLYKILVKHSNLLGLLCFILTLLLFPFFCLLSWLRIFTLKLFKAKPNLLWAPTPILNIADSSELMQKLGYRSKTLVFTVYYISNRFDYNLQPLLNNAAVYWWMPNILFLWSLLFFDIYHFYYDGGLWSGMKIIPKAKWLELPLLRLAGKRIIASAYGADVRTRHRNEMWQTWNLCRECPEPGKYCICDDFAGAKQAKYYRDWCNSLLAMGDMHDYVFASNPHFVYWPIDTNKVTIANNNANETLVIAHSPNHRHFKGTRFIETTVSALAQKGYKIKLDIIERVSNVEAKRRYAAADVIFAQCIAGWFGYTEIEAMAAGKPVLTYMRDEEKYLAHVPSWPGMSVTPDSLEATLEELLKDENKRIALGHLGRKYVEENWSYHACQPKYRALHEQVWHNNNLILTLKKKWQDFFYGEAKYRVGKNIKEFPIWSDPSLALDRINWGLYGRPIFNNEGYLQISLNGTFLQHPGVTALYALHCYHSMLLNPAATHYKEAFLREARWLANFILTNNAKRNNTIDNHTDLLRKGLVEIPWYVNSYRILIVPILLRLIQIEPQEQYEQALHLTTALTSITCNNNGLLLYQQDNYYLLDGSIKFSVSDVPAMLLGIFALYEYTLFYQDKSKQLLLTQLISSMKQISKNYSLSDYISMEYIACDFKMDEYYFLCQSFHTLAKLSGDNYFAKYANKLLRQFYYYRLKNFINLPL